MVSFVIEVVSVSEQEPLGAKGLALQRPFVGSSPVDLKLLLISIVKEQILRVLLPIPLVMQYELLFMATKLQSIVKVKINTQ